MTVAHGSGLWAGCRRPQTGCAPLVCGPVEAAMLDHLAEEENHPLGTVLVLGGEIDLISEEDQPLAGNHGSEDHTL